VFLWASYLQSFFLIEFDSIFQLAEFKLLALPLRLDLAYSLRVLIVIFRP